MLLLWIEMMTMTCSHGFGAADNNPPAGGIPVIEMEAELVVVIVVIMVMVVMVIVVVMVVMIMVMMVMMVRVILIIIIKRQNLLDSVVTPAPVHSQIT